MKIIVLILIAAFKLVSGVAPMFLFPRLRKGGVKKKKLDKVSSDKYWTQSFIQCNVYHKKRMISFAIKPGGAWWSGLSILF